MKILVELWNRVCSACRSTPMRARPALEILEDRSLPSTTGVGSVLGPNSTGQVGREQGGAATDVVLWDSNNNKTFVDALAPTVLQDMYFNNATQYHVYIKYFHGELRSWLAQADAQGISTDAELVKFMGQKLQAEFPQVRNVLAKLYPRQTNETYQLLMAMNLADGYFNYATVSRGYRTVEQTMHLTSGDCRQIADLLSMLVRAEGIPVHELTQSYNYMTPQGLFQASHDVVYADGLWLDAEINTAFAVNLQQFTHISPNRRLDFLLDNHHVFGFYNWYLQPQVRAAQIANGYDGGILSFYYQYYFAGIGQGGTQLHLAAGL
jgi:hypothetical protein